MAVDKAFCLTFGCQSLVTFPFQVSTFHVTVTTYYFAFVWGSMHIVFVLHTIYVHPHVASCSESTGNASLDVSGRFLRIISHPIPCLLRHMPSNLPHGQLISSTFNNCGHIYACLILCCPKIVYIIIPTTCTQVFYKYFYTQ